MAASTASINTLNPSYGIVQAFPVAANTQIWSGTAVMLVAGYLVPAADTATGSFQGLAFEDCNNVAGGNGAVFCRVTLATLDDPGLLTPFMTSPAATDIGKIASWTDDHTVATTTTNSVVGGQIVAIITSGTSGQVKINPRVRA